MKIKRGNLLTVILAILCAVAVAIGVGFALPKNEIKTVRAASVAPLSKTDLDALAAAASYSNYGAMHDDVINSATTLNASSFGSHVVSLGGMDWWPVYVRANGDDIVLTLWLKDSCGSYTWSDGTFGGNTNPPSNNYQYSWIRAAINAGLTAEGYYYGKWADASTSTAAPTRYLNSQKAPAASMAPTAFTTFADFATGGTYADYIVGGGDQGDNLWLPSTAEASATGSWGCNATHWASPSNMWTRTRYTGNYMHSYYLSSTGTTSTVGARNALAIRPAINVKISGATVEVPTATKTTDTYTGSPISFPITYDSSNIDITSVTGKDFNNNPISVSSADIDSSGIFKPTLAGTYEVEFNLNSTAVTDGLQWSDSDGGTDEKTLTFTVNHKPIPVPKITNTPQMYDPNGCQFNVDSNYNATIMTPSGATTDIVWNPASTCFDAVAGTPIGTYSVKFHLDDANYVWDIGSGTFDDQTVTVKIEPKKLEPIHDKTSPAEKEYTGSPIPFSLLRFYSATMKVTQITPIPNTVTDSDGNAWTDATGDFKATDVGTYTFSVKLRDEVNYVWDDDAGGTGERKATFEITQKELGLLFSCDSENAFKTGGEWEYGATPTITFTEGSFATDVLDLKFYWDDETHPLAVTTVDKETTITMPNDITVGKHTLYVAFNSTTGTNANYKLPTKNGYDFEVTSATANTDFKWIYSENGTDKGYITDGAELKYKLNTEYSVAVVIPDDQDYIEITGYSYEKGSTVNDYTTTVSLKSNDSTNLFDDGDGNKSATTTLTFNWKIVQGEFDLSNVKWEYSIDNGKEWKEYSSAVDYNDGLSIKIRVKATSLPQGFKLASTYSGDSQKNVSLVPYTSTVNKAYYEYDTVNFKAPAEISLDWEIKAKNLFSQWKPQVVDFTNANGSGKFIAMVVSVPDKQAEYIEYKYYDMDNGGAEVTFDDIKAAATMTDIKHYKVEAYIKTEHADNYELSDGGATPATTFETGSDKTIATATVDGKTEGITAVYNGNGLFGADGLKVTGDDNQNLDFTVIYYKGETPGDGNGLEGLPTDAGTYVIKFALDSSLEDDYVLMNEWIKVTVLPKPIALPTVADATFNNNFVNFEDLLGGSYIEYKDIAKIVPGGTVDGVKKVNTYTATLTITNPNYCWDNGSEKSTAKKIVKYALADESARWTADQTVASCEWKINPYVLKASGWNLKGKDGAAYNIPTELTEGLDIGINYLYYTDKAGEPLGADEVLKSGLTYFVKAQLADADGYNFVFENGTDKSDFATYTVPQSGAAAALGVLKGFMNRTMLGLPMWAWLAIGLAVLLLLIIIIAVCVKRRKTREEREEAKARKEEERRMQQERLQAERELAMARQQAELEKIRMQTGMAGAGMATMATQQAMPAPAQPVQQQVMPAQQNYQPQPQMQSGYDGGMMERIMAELAALREEQKSKTEAELANAKIMIEFERLRGDMKQYASTQNTGNAIPADVVIALLEAVKSGNPAPITLNTAPVTAALPQSVEESAPVSLNAPAMYPADAVITTTTTVDTTKDSKSDRLRRDKAEREDFMDVDGFYDEI